MFIYINYNYIYTCIQHKIYINNLIIYLRLNSLIKFMNVYYEVLRANETCDI